MTIVFNTQRITSTTSNSFSIDDFNQPTILIFDSGIGGLHIYNEVRRYLKNARYLYIFDNEAFPYGEKEEKFVINRVLIIITAIQKLHKIDMIIIACNTASIMSLSVLRKNISYPIIGTIPAIKPAVLLTRNKVIGLLATQATIKHRYSHKLINQFASNCHVLLLGSPKLAKLAEDKLHGNIVSLSLMRKILNPWINAKIPPDTIILGCTHFAFLKEELIETLPKNIQLVDSGNAIARRAEFLLKHKFYNNNFQNNKNNNKAYCLSFTLQVKILIPVLNFYGFHSLSRLKL